MYDSKNMSLLHSYVYKCRRYLIIIVIHCKVKPSIMIHCYKSHTHPHPHLLLSKYSNNVFRTTPAHHTPQYTKHASHITTHSPEIPLPPFLLTPPLPPQKYKEEEAKQNMTFKRAVNMVMLTNRLQGDSSSFFGAKKA